MYRRAVGEIVLDHVTKDFGNGVLAVNDVSLTIGEGEFMVLVGPSGCGKTTLLRSIGGLEKISEGRIIIGDKDVTRSTPSSSRWSSTSPSPKSTSTASAPDLST